MNLEQPVLQQGDAGPAVSRLQEDLTAVGCFSGEISGEFDQATADSVILFQQTLDQAQDGIVRADTWAALEGPTPTVAVSFQLDDFPSLSLVLRHGSDDDANAYLADLDIDPV